MSMRKRVDIYGKRSREVCSSQEVTIEYALNFVDEVKRTFHDQMEKYDIFLDVLEDFKAQRTDTASVIAKLKDLFKDHRNLILGFNTFVPQECWITIDEDETPDPPEMTVEYEQALGYVNKIKLRFRKDVHVYKSFLNILDMYKKKNKDLSEVYNEVASLFDDHPDLLDEFKKYLPDNIATPSIHHVGRDPNFSEWASGTKKAVGKVGKMLEKAQEGPRRESILQSWFACIGLFDFWYDGKLIADGYINAAKALFGTSMVSTGKGSDTIWSVFARCIGVSYGGKD